MTFQSGDNIQSSQGFREGQGEQAAPNIWAMGLITFAAVMMLVTGTIWFFQGLAGVIEDEFYVVTANYAFDLDASTWGWIHMIGGVLLGVSGLFLFTGNTAARIVALFVACLSIVANFLYVPYYPVWSLLIIAMNIGVIWALLAHGHDWIEE